MMRPRRVAALAALWLALSSCGSGGAEGHDDSAGAMAGMPGMEKPALGRTESPDTVGVPVDRKLAQRLGITFALAAERAIGQDARVVGTLAYAEPRRVYVSARVDGWVERLYADYTGMPVRRGDPLLALYAPALVSAQEEYLAARRLGDSALVAAARRRLEIGRAHV